MAVGSAHTLTHLILCQVREQRTKLQGDSSTHCKAFIGRRLSSQNCFVKSEGKAFGLPQPCTSAASDILKWQGHGCVALPFWGLKAQLSQRNLWEAKAPSWPPRSCWGFAGLCPSFSKWEGVLRSECKQRWGLQGSAVGERSHEWMGWIELCMAGT